MKYRCSPPNLTEIVNRACGVQAEQSNVVSPIPVFLFAFLFASISITSLFLTPGMSGESSILSNVIIDFVTDGLWHYPFHAQHLFYPGVEKFMIHPPVHYLLASLWVDTFGIGIWQLHAQSMAAGILIVLVSTYIAYRVDGIETAIFIPVLATTFAAFYLGALAVRPDMTFGMVYGGFLLLFAVMLRRDPKAKGDALLCTVLGATAVIVLASHWYGYLAQLYLPALAFYRWAVHGGRRFVGTTGAMLVGWALAMALWYSFFGLDLLPSLLIVLVNGNLFNEILPINWQLIIAAFTTWTGGPLLSIGLVLGIALLVLCFIQHLKVAHASRGQLPPRTFMLVFCLSNIAVYALFFELFVGNKSPQYIGNILHLLLMAAAAGWSGLVRIILQSVGRARYGLRVAVVISAATLAISPIPQFYIGHFNNLSLASEQYTGTRNALRTLTPLDGTFLLGGGAYPFLYDVPYESTMLQVAKNSFNEQGPMPLSTLLSHYTDREGIDYRHRPYSKNNRRSHISHLDYLAVTDHGHNWQFLFHDPDVWGPEFRELGIVIPMNDIPKPDFFPFASTLHPKPISVFVKQNIFDAVVDKLPDTLKSSPRLIEVSHGVGVISFVAFDRRPSEFSRNNLVLHFDQWMSLDMPARLNAFSNYMDALDWYGAKISSEQKNHILNAYLPAVHNHISQFQSNGFNGVPLSRSLADGIDYAFTIHGYPPEMPRKILTRIVDSGYAR